METKTLKEFFATRLSANEQIDLVEKSIIYECIKCMQSIEYTFDAYCAHNGNNKLKPKEVNMVGLACMGKLEEFLNASAKIIQWWKQSHLLTQKSQNNGNKENNQETDATGSR